MSFRQEILDFINGFGAGQKILSGYDDKAYKQARMRLMSTQEGINQQKLRDMQDPSLRDLTRREKESQIQYRHGLVRAMDAASARKSRSASEGAIPDTPAAAPSFPDVTPPETPAPAKTSALEDEELYPTQFAARGGAIRADDDDDEDDGVAAGESAGGSASPYSTAAAYDAVRDALIFGHGQLGQGQQGAIPAPQAGQQPGQQVVQYLRGKDAAGQALMRAVHAKIDPQGKLSDSQRTMAGLSAIYQYYLAQGDMNKARGAVYSMLQQHRVNSARYAALAQAAVNGGNLDAAAVFLAKAYDNVPTGKELKVSNENGRLVFSSIDDATGKVIRKGIMTPQELAAAATRLASPDQFDATIAQMAGVRAQKPKAEKAPKAPTFRERDNIRSAIDTELKSVSEEDGEARYKFDGKGKPRENKNKGFVAPGQEDAIGNVATQIQGDNPRLSVRESTAIAYKLVSGRDRPFKVAETNDDGTRVLELDDGRRVAISRDAWLQSAALKGKNKQTADDEDVDTAVGTFKSERAALDRDTARNKVKSEKAAERSRRAASVREQRARMGAENDQPVQPAQAIPVNEEE